MELADILAKSSVLVCADVSSKRQLFEYLANNAAQVTGLDKRIVLAALTDREALGSTGLGNGVAIPHGKIGGLNRVVAVFAKLEPAMDFDAVDDQPVDVVMMLLAPVGAGADHLKALSMVARLLRMEALVEDVRRQRDSKRLYAVLTARLANTYAA